MISVIIPTHNRLEKLKKTLNGFCQQSLDKKYFEVIVIDDGGNDGTQDFISNFIVSTNLNLKYFFQDHSGPERARNFGIEKAQGEIIFFCGDDTCPNENLLKIHLEHHKKEPSKAVLGLALWDETEPVSDFMRYLAPNGPQFHYNTIRNKNSAGFEHFYACNISLAKKWLEMEKFDEKFAYAFEDIDLGLRLEKRGLEIIFDSEAKVYHSHCYDEESFGRRMERVGRGIVIFLDKYKSNKRISGLLKIKYAPFCFFPGVDLFYWLSKILAESKLVKIINLRYHWFWYICLHYALGMREELRKNN